MKRKIYQQQQSLFKYYKKFCNIQKRISSLMRSGEFFDLSRELQRRLIHRLKLLYERVQRLAGKQKLHWAGTAMALMLSAYAVNAQFEDPVLVSGFNSGTNPSPCFVDFDGDDDLDILIGTNEGTVNFYENDEGGYKFVITIEGVDVSSLAKPAMVDLDEDGDLDLVVGNYWGYFSYFRNDDGVFTELTGTDNPFNDFGVYYYASPVFCDIDADDDLDLISGDYWGGVYAYENEGGVFTQLSGTDNPFNDIGTYNISIPRFADWDDDGDLDLYLGNAYGTVDYAENNGGTFTQLTGTDNPFDGIDISDEYEHITPTLLDADNDNDLDLVFGDEATQVLRYFKNAGGTFLEKRGTPNPFEGFKTTFGGAPAFSDMDNDGDLDMFIGTKYGALKYYEKMNEGYIPLGIDLPYDTIVGASMVRPVFADIDADSDEDLIVGDHIGVLHYFEKQGADDFVEMTGGDNPFNGIDVDTLAAPAFADLDEDGDMDCAIGTYYGEFGRISYFENDGGSFTEQLGADNPFDGIYVNDTIRSPLNPAFVDYDRDGDMDLFIGCKYLSTILYYENNEGTFEQMTNSDNPLEEYELGIDPSLAFVDEDEDGDMDLYIGAFYNTSSPDGLMYYVKNTSVPDGINQNAIQESGINIFSNENTIYLDAHDQLIERVEIYSLTGVLITSKNVGTTGQYELNMPDALNGMYLVRAFSNGVPTTCKVLLQ